MTSRVTVFTNAGDMICELDANVKRTWTLSKYSPATFEISTYDAKATKDNLKFGNYLVVEHEKLPTWGGMIDPPRKWKPGVITVTAYSGEYIFTTRRATIKTVNGTAGGLFSQAIQIANNRSPTLLLAGDIYAGGASIEEKFGYNPLYDDLTRIAKDSTQDWAVTPVVYKGRLKFYANWYKKAGVTVTYKLIEDINCELGEFLEEQGTIVNDVMGVGDASVASSKVLKNAIDQTSIDTYGLREGYIDADSNKDATVKEAANGELAKKRNPRFTLRLGVIDVGDIWHYLRLGNTIPVELPSVGFGLASGYGLQTSVRILGMTYDDADNLVDLVVDEVVV